MNFHKCIFTENNCYKVGQKIRPKGIMVHSTGANNPWLKRYVGPDDGLLGKNQYNNHWNQDKPDGKSICVHAFIGKLADGTIATYQTLPWTYRGWHAGGNANNTHISFEICEDNLTNPTYFEAVYKEAVELCVGLCKQYGLTERNIICHSEGYTKGIASNHADVMHWFPKHNKSMDTFRTAVKNALENKEDEDMTQEKFNAMMDGYLARLATQQPGDWSAEERQWAEGIGLIKGNMNGDMQYKSFCTREQMVVFLYRLAEQLKD